MLMNGQANSFLTNEAANLLFTGIYISIFSTRTVGELISGKIIIIFTNQLGFNLR